MAEVVRTLEYDDNDKPVLVLRPKVPAVVGRPVSFAIRMQDLWQYAESHNPDFDKHMFFVCQQIHELFNLGVLTSRKLAEIAWVIEDGIDDMLKMPPPQREKVVVGEAVGYVGSQKISTDVVEERGILH